MAETAKREVMPIIEKEIKAKVRAAAHKWFAENERDIGARVEKAVNAQLKVEAAKCVKRAVKEVRVTTVAQRRRY